MLPFNERITQHIIFYFYSNRINMKNFIKIKLIFFKFYMNLKHILPNNLLSPYIVKVLQDLTQTI